MRAPSPVAARDGIFEIYIITNDGSAQTRLVRRPEQQDARPVYSPDGTQIVFVSLIDLADYEIFLMNADGTGATNLTGHPAWDDFPWFAGSR